MLASRGLHEPQHEHAKVAIEANLCHRLKEIVPLRSIHFIGPI